MHNLTAHVVVKNEEQWIWYALQSVINWVDQIIIYDTGSSDKTVDIIETIKSPKIRLEKKGSVNGIELVELRNLQIAETQTDWFLLLDGDEVWTRAAIEDMLEKVKRGDQRINALVSPAIYPVGDLFHYQPNTAGRYYILGKSGHYNIRCYRKTTKYQWRGVYPLEAYADLDNISIQQKSSELMLLKYPYWHLSYLPRSRFSHKKHKLEIGESQQYSLPEVFYLKRPKIVPSPWVKFTFSERFIAYILSPIIKIKRVLFS